MRIVSTFLPAEPLAAMAGRPAIVMAFDTLVDQKGVVVGITVGRMERPELSGVRVSELGNAIIERCGRHMALNYPQGAVVVAGVAQVAGAKQRVRDVLAKAPPGAFVLLLCANDKVYDAAVPALGIDGQSAHVNPQ